MKIAYLTMVKDESDIIYHNLYYHYGIGIRDFYIIDNGSIDNTLYYLYRFRDERSDCFVHIESDPSIEYWQYKRINHLANLAHSNGCTWMFPVDADEFLFENNNLEFNIYSWLSQFNHEEGYIEFLWWYYRMTPTCNEDEKNPIYRMCHRDLIQTSALTKVLPKWQTGMEICQGNHNLHNKGSYKRIETPQLYLAHYSCRGYKHIKRKTINLGLAYLPIRDSFYHNSVDLYHQYLREGDDYIYNRLNYEYSFKTDYNDQIIKSLNKVYSSLGITY